MFNIVTISIWIIVLIMAVIIIILFMDSHNQWKIIYKDYKNKKKIQESNKIIKLRKEIVKLNEDKIDILKRLDEITTYACDLEDKLCYYNSFKNKIKIALEEIE